MKQINRVSAENIVNMKSSTKDETTEDYLERIGANKRQPEDDYTTPYFMEKKFVNPLK